MIGGLPRRAVSVMDECAYFAGGVAALAMSPVVIVGDVAVKVMLLTDAGILFLADPAGVVTIGVAPLADAQMVTVIVTDAGILCAKPRKVSAGVRGYTGRAGFC